MIIDEDGHTIKSTFDVNLSKKYSNLITKLIEQTKACVKDMDESVSWIFIYMLIFLINWNLDNL